MRAREIFMAVAMALVLGLGVVLPGYATFGDRYNHDIVDNVQVQYIAAEDTAKEGKSNKAIVFTDTLYDAVYADIVTLLPAETVAATIRLFPHYPGDNPAFYYEIEMPDIDTVIPIALRPVLRTMYGTAGTPGWAFLGWYENVYTGMHYTNYSNRITHAQRLNAINLLANLIITNAMLDANGVFELHASWLRFGDLNGNGTICPVDRTLMQNRILGSLTNDDIIWQTFDLECPNSGYPIPGIVGLSLLRNHILGAPGVILGPIQR